MRRGEAEQALAEMWADQRELWRRGPDGRLVYTVREAKAYLERRSAERREAREARRLRNRVRRWLAGMVS